MARTKAVLDAPDDAPDVPDQTIEGDLPKVEAATSPKVGFFEQISSYTRADWELCLIYVYRLAPVTDRLAGGNPAKFLVKYSESIDEDRLKHDHGSGRYRLILNKLVGETKKSRPIRTLEVDIEDPKFPPNVPPGEWVDDPRNKRWAWARDIKKEEPAAAPAPGQQLSPFELLKLVKDTVREMMPQAPASTQADTTRAVLDAIKTTHQEISAASDPGKLLHMVREIISLSGSKESGSSDLVLILTKMSEASDRRAEAAEKRAEAAQARSDQMMLKLMEGKSAGGGMQETMGLMTSMMDFANKMKGGEDGGGGLSGWKGVLASTAEYIPAALGHVEGIVKSVVGAPRRVVPLQANAATPGAPQAPAIQQGQAIEVTTEEEPVEMTPQQKIMQKYARFVPMLTQHIGMSLASDDHGYEFAERFINMLGRGTYDEIASLGAEGVTALLKSHEDSYATISTSPRLAGFLAEFLKFPEGVPAELEADDTEPEPVPAPKTKKGGRK